MVVAAHKKVDTPTDSLYIPVYVGSAFHRTTPAGFLRDDSGKNISLKNPNYNELTAVYWAKYNLLFDAVGFVHYRRYFVRRKRFLTKKYTLIDKNDIGNLLKHAEVVVPKKRRYFIETIESHFYNSHESVGLDKLKIVMENQTENYRKAFSKIMHARSAHMFNMFIMKRREFDAYTDWLFPLLKEVDNSLDYNHLSGNEKRIDGFLSEFLLDVWLEANSVPYVECDYKFTEKQHWVRKIYGFLFNKWFSKGKFKTTHISNE